MLIPDELLFHPGICDKALRLYIKIRAISGILGETEISVRELGFKHYWIKKPLEKLENAGFIGVVRVRGKVNKYFLAKR